MYLKRCVKIDILQEVPKLFFFKFLMNFKILGDSLKCEYTMDDGEEEKVCNFIHQEPVCVKYHRVLENGKIRNMQNTHQVI